MELLITLLILLLFGVGWLLLAPIVLMIDTQKELFYLQWKGIGKLGLVFLGNDIALQVQVFFWRKNFYPLSRTTTTSSAQEKKKKEKKSKPVKKKKPKMTWRRGKRLLQSFTIRTFQVNLDTDDFIQNSYLFPIFYFLSNEQRQLKINYSGEAVLKLVVQNRLYSLLKAWLF